MLLQKGGSKLLKHGAQAVHAIIEGLVGGQQGKPAKQITPGKAVDVLDFETFLIVNRIEIDGDGLLISEQGLVVIAEPLAAIFKLCFVSFADIGVESDQICFEHKSITLFAPICLLNDCLLPIPTLDWHKAAITPFPKNLFSTVALMMMTGRFAALQKPVTKSSSWPDL